MNEATPAIIAVGHCGPDSWMLRNTVERALPGPSRFVVADSDAALSEAFDAHPGPTLLLVNRRLDGDFADGDGIGLIRTALGAGRDDLAAVLVSNLPDAQAKAVEAGARPGFGKSALHDEATADVVRTVVGDLVGG